jgi:hypothetical protein
MPRKSDICACDLGEEVARRREVDGLHMLGEFAKPVFDYVKILENGLRRAQAHCVALWSGSGSEYYRVYVARLCRM